jgi:hypothetical protein
MSVACSGAEQGRGRKRERERERERERDDMSYELKYHCEGRTLGQGYRVRYHKIQD